ncbi:cadherin-like domain-containing protein [Ensifer adhaerens]|uniref:calcium-binding protein n=1 Tax=Ensifer adhaerens TaxID=106592 RepID=UPI00235A329C|nr:cadherin-like domain-containing protein [Ensifer adhaerens]UAX94954.1 cadherin-like domain-containing protein [Ensifer adhaerens]UAX97242.1 cadherin-like domain-containing protein [Ensifer adhaerens]UAY03155.1 cadherin-like domain-containing protein [Ensifer adhaerens]UAY11140.1 cadherin-like domain-containing protein [Ensifer adhaerens]
MDEKLILKRPDSQQAIAPMNRYAIADKPERKRGRLVLSALFLGALGSVLGSKDGESEPANHDRDPEPVGSEPPGEALDMSGALEAIEDAAAYIQGLLADLAFPDEVMPAKLGRLRSSVRLAFDDGAPNTDLIDERPFKTGTRPANDNGLQGFDFPGLASFGSPPSGRSDGNDDDDDDGGSPGGGDDDDDNGGPGGPGGPGGDDDDDDGSARSNRLPVVTGRNVLANGLMNLSAVILLDDLLANTVDPDGDRLSIANLTVSNGSVRAYGEGMWLYTPERGDLGEVTFTYSVFDGTGRSVNGALMTLMDWPANEIRGTEGDDVMRGTPQKDIIAALGGDDIVYGREADDIILGGSGDDTLIGGDGNDTLYGEAGNDRLYGGRGNDILFGGTGDDHLYGEEGDDILLGEAGDDYLSGGDGDDRLFGEEGRDVLDGDAGNDLLDGGAGSDRLTGGAGKDTVLAGAGDDIIVTGLSAEEARSALPPSSDGNDHYSGGEGHDTLDASSARETVVIDLQAGTATGAEIGSDTIDSIESVIAGSGDDQLKGNDADNTFVGGAGNDVVSAGAGDDTIIVAVQAPSSQGDDGDDHYDGGTGNDTLDAGSARETVIIDLEAGIATGAEIGSDTLANIENVIAGSGNDVITGDDGCNTLIGGNGDDVVSGGGGNDTIVVVAFDGSGDADHDGNDSYSGGDGIDTLDLSALVQAVLADMEAGIATGEEIGEDRIDDFEIIVGGRGSDRISGSRGNDMLFGGHGNDRLRGRDGDDVLVGGAGDDELKGEDGNDTFVVVLLPGTSDGDDTIDGGAGVDGYDASAATQAVVIDLDRGIAAGAEIGNDSLRSVETAVGGKGNDIIVASDAVNFLAGGAGADIFVFRSLAALANGGEGRDEIRDFEVGDRIDLSKIAEALGGLAFAPFADDGSPAPVNRITFYHETFSDSERTVVRAVIDLERDEDLEFLIAGRHALTEQDFILAAFETAAEQRDA